MNSPWFDDKSEQVSVSTLTAFGIALETRYGVARELAELLMFADAAAASDVNLCVVHALYDSKTCCCWLTLRDADEAQKQAVFDAAMATLSQFDWEGQVFHGAPLPDSEEPL